MPSTDEPCLTGRRVLQLGGRRFRPAAGWGPRSRRVAAASPLSGASSRDPEPVPAGSPAVPNIHELQIEDAACSGAAELGGRDHTQWACRRQVQLSGARRTSQRENRVRKALVRFAQFRRRPRPASSRPTAGPPVALTLLRAVPGDYAMAALAARAVCLSFLPAGHPRLALAFGMLVGTSLRLLSLRFGWRLPVKRRSTPAPR